MSNIKTYADLEAEKLRLMALLRNHEESIKSDFANVREGLQPVNNALKVINKLATRDNRVPAMNFGLEMGITCWCAGYCWAALAGLPRS